MSSAACWAWSDLVENQDLMLFTLVTMLLPASLSSVPTAPIFSEAVQPEKRNTAKKVAIKKEALREGNFFMKGRIGMGKLEILDWRCVASCVGFVE